MQTPNLPWVHWLRATASFLVVLLHAAAPHLYRYNKLPPADWWAANLYDSAAHAAVPLFFMLSGFLLLPRQEPLPAYFRRRFQKILIPLLAWSFIYLLWQGKAAHNFFLTPVYYHLWFLYALLGQYLLLPILRVLVAHTPRAMQYYFVLLWFLGVGILPMLQKTIGLQVLIDLGMASGYVGFVLLGHLLGTEKTSPRRLLFAVFLAITSLILTIALTGFYTDQNNGQLETFFYDYLSPNMTLLSAASFFAFRAVMERHGERGKVASLGAGLSALSFGVYLVHPIFLSVFAAEGSWLAVFAQSHSVKYTIPLYALAAYLASVLVTFLLRKIPLLRQIVP